MNDIGQVAAIWCRVSTHDQRELSLESQETAVRRALDMRGYQTPPQYLLKADWTSLDLMACPEFQRLRKWIASGEVQAVGLLDRDRLQAQGLQRLLFLSECQERGVEVVTVQGVPMMEGAEGQLVELALALGKERSVQRAQQGARDGIRDRVVLQGKPANGRAPLGFRWEQMNGQHRLVPDRNYPVAKRIWREFLGGVPLRAIAKGLTRDGVPTLHGAANWGSSTIYSVVTNPAYSGRYAALRWETVEPERRFGSTYGKSSVRRRRDPVDMPHVVVEDPVVTPHEFAHAQERLKLNKLHADRRARGVYILRGMVRCDRCGRAMGGGYSASHGYHVYRCSKCTHNRKGPSLEEAVWDTLVSFLMDPELVLQELENRQGDLEQEQGNLQRQLQELNKRSEGVTRKRQKAFEAFTSGLIDDEEVYRRTDAAYKSEAVWVEEEQERIKARQAALGRAALTAERIRHFQTLVEGKLKGADPKQRRWVMECLGVLVRSSPGKINVEVTIPEATEGSVSTIPWCCDSPMGGCRFS